MVLETIALGLLTNFIYDSTGKMLGLTIEHFKSISDKKYLNKPFYLAFVKTCEYFKEQGKSLYAVNPQIFDELSKLDEIAINALFGKVNIEIEQIKNNFDCSFFSEGLKYFIAINYPNEKYEKDFYEALEYVFKENYKIIFKELCSANDILFNKFMLDVVGITLESLETIQKNVEIIKETTAKTDRQLSSTLPRFEQKLDTLINEKLYMDTDILLLPIETTFKDKEFKKCIKLISEKYLSKEEQFLDEQKAKIYVYKGCCELNLNLFEDAEKSLKTSIQRKKSDNALANLCKCSLNSNEPQKISDIIDLFEDMDGNLYQETRFYYLFYSQSNLEEAEKHLENNKDKIRNYYHLKARLLHAQRASYEDAIHYFKLYLKENPDDKIAKYELLTSRFSKLFEGNLIHFSFSTTLDFNLSVYPVTNKHLNKDELNSLIADVEEALNQNFEQFFHVSLLIMSAILHSQKADLSIAQKYKSEILQNVDLISDEFNANNACMACFLLNDFKNAHHIYKKHLTKTDDSLNVLILILFGLAEYKQCYEILEKNDLEDLNIIKLIVRYNQENIDEFINKIKSEYQNYSLKDKLFIADICFKEKEYDFCKNKYIEIANEIIEEKLELYSDMIIMLVGKLNFFQEQSLEKELLDFQWNNYPTPENFEIGLRCAINLYNNHQISDCVLILNKLSEFQPNHSTIKELYRNIDIQNNSFEGIIQEFEEGVKSDNTLYYVAIGYIRKKSFDKASKVIEQLKFLPEQKFQYYRSKTLLLALTQEYDELFLCLKEASNEMPTNLEIKKIIFSMVITYCSNINLPDDFKLIYHDAIDTLVKNGIMYQFQVSKENPIEDLQNEINKIVPLNEENEKNEVLEELFDQYKKSIMPIQIMYPFVNINKIPFWIEVLNDKYIPKNLIIGTQLNNIDGNFEILDKNPNVLIGFEALILLKELDIENEVKEKINLKISGFTEEDLKNYLDEYKNIDSKGTLGRDINNNIWFNKKSNIEKKYILFLKSIIPHYEKVSFKSSNIKNVAILKAAENIGDSKLFNEALACSQEENTLVWLDGTLSQIYNEFGINTVSTFDVLQYLTDKKIITNKQLAKCKVKLCKLNCRIIPISADDLYYAIINDYNDFTALLDTFNYANFTLESLIFVIRNLIVKLNDSKEISHLRIPVIIKALFDKFMLLYPNGEFIFNLFAVLAINFIYFKDDLQANIGINLYASFKPEIVIKFYTTLLIALNKAISPIDANRDILMRKIILNAPIEIKENIKDFAKTHLHYIELVDS